jgi:hypothetical protein
MLLSKTPSVALSEPVRVRHSNSELNWAYSFRGGFRVGGSGFVEFAEPS